MFLVDDILMLPVTGPVKFIKFLGERILEQEEGEIGDIEAEVLEAETRFLLDEIDEEEFRQAEDRLLHRLDALVSGAEAARGADIPVRGY